MWCNVQQPGSFAAGLYHVPHNVLRDPFAPHFAGPSNRAKDSSFGNTSRRCPLVQGGLDPPWNRDRTDVTALADQVHNRPVTLPHLHVIQA